MTPLLRALARFVGGSASRLRRQHRPAAGQPQYRRPTDYRHRCADGEVKVGSDRVCATCGVTGKLAGWTLSSAEHWGRFRNQTGLNPLRPKPSDAVELLWKVLQTCSVCEGVGYCEDGNGCRQLCTACDGRGTIPGLSDPRVQDVLRGIEERCPGAVAPGVIVPETPDVAAPTRND